MKVPDVRRNLVPDTWTADEKGAFSPHHSEKAHPQNMNKDSRKFGYSAALL